MNHCMIDIETMGNRPNAPVLSIGAVKFDPDTGALGDKFYAAISPVDAFRHGTPDGDTLKWWMEQGDEARRAAVGGQKLLREALEDLSRFYGSWKDVIVWGNGPSFDMTILEYAYHRAVGSLAPWRFWNVACCRTIALAAGRRPPRIDESKGTYHNALDDAIHQAGWVSEMWQSIKNKSAVEQPKAQVSDRSSTLLDF